MIAADAACDALGVHVGSLRVAACPLLQSCFAWRELVAAHGANGALTFVGLGLILGADCPSAASASDTSTWSGYVMCVRGVVWLGWTACRHHRRG